MICQICSDLISAAETVLEERTTGESGSPEEWFYCPNCWYAIVSISRWNLKTKTLLQRLEAEPVKTVGRIGISPEHSTLP